MAKKVLITGGSGGIGKQTAISLAKEGFNVIITGKSLKSCTDAIAEIKDKSNNDNVDFIISDFNSLKSVQLLADEYKIRHNSLDILINNIGVLKEIKQYTIDGIELNFTINVLSPYLLSNLLLDLLMQSSNGGRIITLSGGMPLKKLDFQNLQAEKIYMGIVTYSHSKMLMMTLMYSFGKGIENKQVKSNICYPGQASTAMTQALTAQMFPWFFRFLFPLLKFANQASKKDPDKSAKRASQSSVYLAISPDVYQLHNSYINFKSKKVAFPKPVLSEDNQTQIQRYANKIIKEKLGINIS